MLPSDSKAVYAAKAESARVSDAEIMRPFLFKSGFLLARVDQICTALFSEYAAEATLNQAEFMLLLKRLGSMPQIRLARSAGIDRSTTAHILENLEARGWVSRAGCPEDRRLLLVSLTAAGLKALPAVRRSHARLERALQAPLDGAELSWLTAKLHQLGVNPLGKAPVWIPACQPAEGVLDTSLSFLARRGLQLFQAEFISATQESAVTLRQFSLLFILSIRGSVTQVEFARIFGLDPSTCGVIMHGLARRRLIASKPSREDRRARIFTLTEAGRDLLRRLHPIVDQSEAEVMRGVSARDRDKLVRQLRAIVKAYSASLRFPGAIESL